MTQVSATFDNIMISSRHHLSSENMEGVGNLIPRTKLRRCGLQGNRWGSI